MLSSVKSQEVVLVLTAVLTGLSTFINFDMFTLKFLGGDMC